MTERKPAGTSFESWIDAQVRAAQDSGAFDNLPGAGKPFADAGQPFDPDWWLKQMIRREQITGADVLPPQVKLLRTVEKELAEIARLDDEATVRRRIEALNAQIVAINARATEGPPTRLAPFDVERALSRWREARSAAKSA